MQCYVVVSKNNRVIKLWFANPTIRYDAIQLLIEQGFTMLNNYYESETIRDDAESIKDVVAFFESLEQRNHSRQKTISKEMKEVIGND